MKKSAALLCITLLGFFFSCNSDKKAESNSGLFNKDNLVAWCVVPFDSVERTPEQRAMMLNELGIKQLAYDWRTKHLPTFPLEIRSLKYLNIRLKAVWIWIDPEPGTNLIDSANSKIFETVKQMNVKTDFWVGFANRYFEGLSDDEKLSKAVTAVNKIDSLANSMECTISLYNHGDWFGEPLNQIRIIEKTRQKDIGIVYNFHHAHSQVAEFPALLEKMLPYLRTVNLNGMKVDGPKILPLSQGDRELEMLKTLKASGYNGTIGIIGHVENDDVKVVLQRNLDGLKKLLETMGDEHALATYKDNSNKQ